MMLILLTAIFCGAQQERTFTSRTNVVSVPTLVLDGDGKSNRDEWAPNIDILAIIEDIHQAMRKDTPRALASITGGESETFTTHKRFESNMLDFTNHLYSRYRLSFAPEDPKLGLHQIRVRLREPKAGEKLLFRTSYWVAEENSERPGSAQ